MQGSPLGCGDDIGRGPRPRSFGDFDLPCCAERVCNTVQCGERLAPGAGAEIAACAGDAQPGYTGGEYWSDRFIDAVGADGIMRVGSGHRVIRKRQIGGVACEWAEVIEAGYEREAAGARQTSIRRLQTEDATERRRHADRAVGVGTERNRHQTAGDRAARSAGRTSGHPRSIVGIARGAVVAVLAGEVIGVFAHVQCADQDRAGGFKSRDQRCVGGSRRMLAVDLRAGERRQAGDVDQVLHRERHAGERSRRICHGTRAGAFGGDGGKGVQHRVAAGNARERLFDHLRRSDSPAQDGRRNSAGRSPCELCHA